MDNLNQESVSSQNNKPLLTEGMFLADELTAVRNFCAEANSLLASDGINGNRTDILLHFTDFFAFDPYGKRMFFLLAEQSDQRDEKYGWTPQEWCVREVLSAFVTEAEDRAGGCCLELAYSKSEVVHRGEASASYNRHAGDRDSFGWLIGVEEITVRAFGRSITLSVSWG